MSFDAGKAPLVTFQSYIRHFRPSEAPSRRKWAIWQQERTFLLPTSTSTGKAEQHTPATPTAHLFAAVKAL